MPILGSHMSIAGGVHKAVELADKAGCDCVQIFTASPSRWSAKPPNSTAKTKVQSGGLLTKNNNQWRAKELTDDDVARFQDALARLAIKHPIAHNSYLINLANPDPALWQRSVDAFVIELLRAERLGIPYVVAHPGAFVSDTEQGGLSRIVSALDEVHQQTRGIAARCLLETTAGQGSCLGWRFEHLAAILDGVQNPDRLGVCFDTCHVFAAGYPLGAPDDYRQTMREFERIVGIRQIKAFHLNDSKRELGSRVDRHEHIGEGKLGIEAFRNLLNDSRFRQVPMYLETAKGKRGEEDLDVINLRTLRELCATAKAAN